MATVPIPWFRGGPMMLGKAQRKQRQLQALSGFMGEVGGVLRRNRTTAEDDQKLADQEASLETQLGESQARAHQDSKSQVERAHDAGGNAEAIKADPAGVADATHDENQSALQKVGDFVETGVQKLLFGDPKRAERMTHIRQMQAKLDLQKRKEEFIKNVGPTAMRSQDPGSVFKAAGGGQYGITGPFPRAATGRGGGGTQEAGDIPGPAKVGGGLTDRARWTKAAQLARQKKNGADPTQDEINNEFLALVAADREAREAAREASYEKHFRERHDEKVRDEKDKGTGEGYSETFTVDEQGNPIGEKDRLKALQKNLKLGKRTVRHKGQPPKLDVPITTDDPGREFGVDFFGGGQ